MPCDRCGKQNPEIIHTCTPSRKYMLEIIQKEISDWSGCKLNEVLAWLEETGVYLDEYYNDTSDNILRKRKEKRKSLSEQSEDCISYIYSLLPPEVRK